MSGTLKIESVEMVCVWNYDVENAICPVCNIDLQSPTRTRMINGTTRNDVSVGECNHGVHLECIAHWLNSNVSCPICRTEWVGAKNVSSGVYVCLDCHEKS